ncbi:MAG: hypothetical protein ACI9LM_004812 [Alteromonadaceae bacterium]|jgi:hypothetical protein
MNYMSVIERYHEHKSAIHELMASIFAGAFDKKLFNDELLFKHSLKRVSRHYPFVELMFTLDDDGVQTSKNISNNISDNKNINNGLGIDRSYRPYFIKANDNDGIVVTDPYLSSSSFNLCISTALKYRSKSGEIVGILVIDINLANAIEFLMGDRKRKKFHPFLLAYTLLSLLVFFSLSVFYCFQLAMK